MIFQGGARSQLKQETQLGSQIARASSFWLMSYAEGVRLFKSLVANINNRLILI